MNKFKSIAFMVFFSFLISSPAIAFDYSTNIFKFQTKLANKGDPTAQYKLGTMYESGTGTEKNLDEALKWYKKSSDQNNKAAIRRITYIEIIKTGYNKKQHSEWLTTLMQDAAAKDGEAAFLLGTMYKNGIGVKGSLLKAKKLIRIASRVGVSGADHELINIKNIISTKREQAAKKRNKTITKNRTKNKELQEIAQKKRFEQKRLAEKNLRAKLMAKKRIEVVDIEPKKKPVIQEALAEKTQKVMDK